MIKKPRLLKLRLIILAILDILGCDKFHLVAWKDGCKNETKCDKVEIKNAKISDVLVKSYLRSVNK